MSNSVSDFKLNRDIEKYKKMGLDDRTSIIVACSINGIPEKANDILLEMNDEQAEIRRCLKDMVIFSNQYLSDLEVANNELENDQFPRVCHEQKKEN